jgi:hypothetical protein
MLVSPNAAVNSLAGRDWGAYAIWGRKNSYNVQKVMWLVVEIPVPHTYIEPGGTRLGGSASI